MRKKGKYTSNPDPDLDSLRQKQKTIINKMKCAWRWRGGPAGLCQVDNPRSRPVGPKCVLGGDVLLTQATSSSGARESGFPGERLESGQLCPGSAQLRPGSSLELGSEGLGCRTLRMGSVPHSLCVRGEGAASQLSIFQSTLPFHSFQTGFTLKLCWKHLGLGRFFSGEDFIPWAWE